MYFKEIIIIIHTYIYMYNNLKINNFYFLKNNDKKSNLKHYYYLLFI